MRAPVKIGEISIFLFCKFVSLCLCYTNKQEEKEGRKEGREGRQEREGKKRIEVETSMNSLPCHSFFFFCLFDLSRAAPAAYGGSQARGLIGAVAASLCQSHSNAISEPHVQSTPQLMSAPDP